MSNSDNVRKHELQCLRMAADCTQLSRTARHSAQQAHFLRMAEVWARLEAAGPILDNHIKVWN